MYLQELVAGDAEHVAGDLGRHRQLEEQDEPERRAARDPVLEPVEGVVRGQRPDHRAPERAADAVGADAAQHPSRPEQRDAQARTPGFDGNRRDDGGGEERDHRRQRREHDEQGGAEAGMLGDDPLDRFEDGEDHLVQRVGGSQPAERDEEEAEAGDTFHGGRDARWPAGFWRRCCHLQVVDLRGSGPRGIYHRRVDGRPPEEFDKFRRCAAIRRRCGSPQPQYSGCPAGPPRRARASSRAGDGPRVSVPRLRARYRRER